MANNINQCVKQMKIATPELMEYHVTIDNAKAKRKFIDRVKKIIRTSDEYRDYIKFLKENMDMDKCIFFQHVQTKKDQRMRVSIEVHHEPFTLEDYVTTMIQKFEDEGQELNDLLIAEEVLELHYANKVGLVPLSKTMHQMVHNSEKLLVPLNMCYGEYSKFLEEYDIFVDDQLYEKLDKKMKMTEELTPESFDAIKKEFTYINVKDFEDIEKIPIEGAEIA